MIDAVVYRFPEDANLIRQDFDLMRVIFTNGCFDILHPGHLRVIARCAERARNISGVVVVGVNSDASVRTLKGPDRPVFGEQQRAEMVGMLKDVYAVVIFQEETPTDLIDVLDPELVVKGGDYRQEDVVSGGRPVEIVPTYGTYSTTRVILSMK